MKPVEKGKCKPLTGYFDENRDYFGMFEDTEPPKPKPIERAD